MKLAELHHLALDRCLLAFSAAALAARLRGRNPRGSKGTGRRVEPRRHRRLHERLRARQFHAVPFRRHTHPRLENGARSLREEIRQLAKRWAPLVSATSKSRRSAPMRARGQDDGSWSGKRDKPHGRFTLDLSPPAGRLADRARSHFEREVVAKRCRRPAIYSATASARRQRIFSWIPSKPPLLKTTTTSSVFNSGTSRSTICAASGS